MCAKSRATPRAEMPRSAQYVRRDGLTARVWPAVRFKVEGDDLPSVVPHKDHLRVIREELPCIGSNGMAWQSEELQVRPRALSRSDEFKGEGRRAAPAAELDALEATQAVIIQEENQVVVCPTMSVHTQVAQVWCSLKNTKQGLRVDGASKNERT